MPLFDFRPHHDRQSAALAGSVTLLVLVASWIFAGPKVIQCISILFATPIVLVAFLVTLAIANVVFSVLYTRRHKLFQRFGLPWATTNTTASSTSAQHQLRESRPGEANRHFFHHLRPAYFSRPEAWSTVERRRKQEQAAKYRTPIADTMPQFSEAIDTVIELILRDYVSGWMRVITPEIVLQQRIEELLRLVLIRLKLRVMDLDLTQLLVTRLVPKVTAHVNDFRKADMALRGDRLERKLTESDELDLLVASKFRDGQLHKALSTSSSTRPSELAYLRVVVQALLPSLLPKNEAQSEVLRLLIREILVGAVLRPVMDLMSDPDYWNQNVDHYIGKAIREQNMVKKLREALNQHTDTLESKILDNPDAIRAQGGELYSFEDFLKMIKRCDSLLDVKRIRNTIMTQIRKKKTLIANRDKDDIVNGNKVEDIIVYINRLEVAKRRAEKRIEGLGGQAYPKRNGPQGVAGNGVGGGSGANGGGGGHGGGNNGSLRGLGSSLNLETILANPTGVSYFMEFQDRRNCMNELQFWLLVETFNFRAKTAEGGEEDGQSSSAHVTPTATLSKKTGQTLTADTLVPMSSHSSVRSRRSTVASIIDPMDTLKEDIRMIYDMYFADNAPRRIDVDIDLVESIHDFCYEDNLQPTLPAAMATATPTAGGDKKVSTMASSTSGAATTKTTAMTSTAETEPSVTLTASGSLHDHDPVSKALAAKEQLLEAQQQIFDQMATKDFSEFIKSDLYFKFLTSYQNSLSATGASNAPPSTATSTGQGGDGGLLSPRQDHHPMSPDRKLDNTSKRTSAGSFLEIFGLGGGGKDKEREKSSSASSSRILQHGTSDHHTAYPSMGSPTLFGFNTSSSSSNGHSNNNSQPDLAITSPTLYHERHGSAGSNSDKSTGGGGRVGGVFKASRRSFQSPLLPFTPAGTAVGTATSATGETSVMATPATLTTAATSKSAKLTLADLGSPTMIPPRDLGDSVGGLISPTGSGSKLGDSLILELESSRMSEDGTTEGLKITSSASPKARRGKANVIDAVEAALSSIMETNDDGITLEKNENDRTKDNNEDEDDDEEIDATDPSFATAREGSELLKWGENRQKAAAAAATAATVVGSPSQQPKSKKHSREKSLGGRTVRVKQHSKEGSESSSSILEDMFAPPTVTVFPGDTKAINNNKSSATNFGGVESKGLLSEKLSSSLSPHQQKQQQKGQGESEVDDLTGGDSSSSYMSEKRKGLGLSTTNSTFTTTAIRLPSDQQQIQGRRKQQSEKNDRPENDNFDDEDDDEDDSASGRSKRNYDKSNENVHLAAPGDLLLASRIERIEQELETIRKQERIVETLIQKAERQGRQNELRILKKSKSALRREILSMEYQKTQYEVQEEENMIMPDRSTINITSSTVGYDGSKEFALYVIEVHQLAPDGSYASGWVIARRYSEFFALHQQLKDKFANLVRHYELPGKRGFLKLQRSFVENRRIGLEKYLQQLVHHVEICQSQELRAFLSQENVALPQFSAASSSSVPTGSNAGQAGAGSLSSMTSGGMSEGVNNHQQSTDPLANVPKSSSGNGGRFHHQRAASSSMLENNKAGVGMPSSPSPGHSSNSPYFFEQLFHSQSNNSHNNLSTQTGPRSEKQQLPLTPGELGQNLQPQQQHVSPQQHQQQQPSFLRQGRQSLQFPFSSGDGRISENNQGSHISSNNNFVGQEFGGSHGNQNHPSAQNGFMKHIYQTVSEGIDDMFSGGPPTVLGNITKQLGNQMLQFSIVDDEEESAARHAVSQHQAHHPEKPTTITIAEKDDMTRLSTRPLLSPTESFRRRRHGSMGANLTSGRGDGGNNSSSSNGPSSPALSSTASSFTAASHDTTTATTVSEGLDVFGTHGTMTATRPPLTRSLSSSTSRSRRLSSPDPHTQHQKHQQQRQSGSGGGGIFQPLMTSMPILLQSASTLSTTQSSVSYQDVNTKGPGVSTVVSNNNNSSINSNGGIGDDNLNRLSLGVSSGVVNPTVADPRRGTGTGGVTTTVVESEGVTTFTEPLCDLFIELFELKDKNNWLRRQAVVIILQQVLGGTIERKLRDTIKSYIEESMLVFYVLKLRDVLWPFGTGSTPGTGPGGPTTVGSSGSPPLGNEGWLSGEYEVVGNDLSSRVQSPPTSKLNGSPSLATAATAAATVRTPEQKSQTKDQASRKLSVFLPELLGNMVGHQNARRGARRVFAAFQNRRLNQQLCYTALDEVVANLWPEVVSAVTNTGLVLVQEGGPGGGRGASGAE